MLRFFKPFLRRHLCLFVFALAGLIIGAGLAGFFSGGVLGYFLDEFLFIRKRRKETGQFFLNQDPGTMDDEEIRVLSAGFLYFAVRTLEGIPLEILRSPGEEKPVLSFLGGAGKTRHILERITGEYFAGDMDTAMLAGPIIALNSQLTPSEKMDFLSLASGNSRTVPLAPPASRLLTRIAGLWGIPRDRISSSIINTLSDDDPWILLDLEPGAAPEDIRRNYRLLAAQFHPDTNRDLSESQKREANEAFMRIKNAYDALKALPGKGSPGLD